ncbi:2-amino-4-hydroxy-6-hydroxymethyldihydropteridine diphosphokinase [Candidatus Riesia pediculicola]|uniref:2-amino-4-hydroxy-6-hydroxymethyldihydropteridine pyrophosphokinase n=1 Tax=Riesia pediculicola (strain USDA) TaxID=515618 RepID=D4G814_RIEPU|nr:2-amino-4-hydroxy-6-hydroxymethyldihydropteridine diphosphokinase [Candidatus Riesia pediculicola]ADD79937.1 2-amino-4-hydroxy-6-hydroxymethyldihydropteridine pyrophosphokinase [Candidatus Riesia pediculicola USDA]ARC53722.1 2-amino-4-hydroxy-6-hydroxymethyldihydropteridine pyrophosphokinase [Candidatus Riesia pediculicola]QOJ86364.1 2-amino-4-hydroxy-6-hydroxymethyldihydropteridine diphosphokinase [Candidatus Riesia pediculicola]
MKKLQIAYISVGSNLNNPIYQADRSIISMRNIPDTDLISVSSYYRTKPIGNSNQPDYLNAVVSIKTQLSPKVLLSYIQKIEFKQGRTRTKEKWTSRTLDLDILLYGNMMVKEKNLVIPHPELKNRYFLLYMIYKEDPNLIFPDGQSILDMMNKCQKVSFSVLKKNPL